MSEMQKEIQEGLNSVKSEISKANSEINERIKAIGERQERGEAATVEQKTAFQDAVATVSKLESSVEDLIAKQTKLNDDAPAARKSIGEMAAENERLKSYEGGKMTLATVNSSFRKAITSDAASAGAFTTAENVGYRGMMRPYTFRDLFTVVSVNSNAVEYVREKAFTNNAAPQAGEGALKAQSNLEFEKVNAPVETMAHFIKVSRQVLSDAGQLRDVINRKCVNGLEQAIEAQLIAGSGTSNNLDGVKTNAIAYDTSLSAAGDTTLDLIRRGLYQASLSDYMADGIVLNELDWMNIEMLKTSDNAYLFTNPINGAEARLWGKRVVASNQMTAGEWLVGAFGTAATLYDREQTSVRLSESDQDDFVKNVITILVEERLALAVEAPSAFVTGAVA